MVDELKPSQGGRSSTTIPPDATGDGDAQLDPISVENVSFGYGDTSVIEKLDLSFGSGETVGIVGPSGCGKSTLLRLIAGFQQPHDGRIAKRLDPSLHCPISMMFQSDTLVPWMTAEQNVLLFSKFRRWRRSALRTSKAELKTKAEELFAMVHLEEATRKYPYQMSGGMRRRLAFATAVAPNPQVLLLDEPFTSVDEPTRIKIHQDVFNSVKELNLTTILVTHDIAEAVSMCDRVVILSRRPAMIVAEHRMPFGDVRDMKVLRDKPAFMQVYGDVWRDLSGQL